jgi:hypothetical protein
MQKSGFVEVHLLEKTAVKTAEQTIGALFSGKKQFTSLSC